MNTFPKKERLCGIKLIADLYQDSCSFLCYPYKINWKLSQNSETPVAKVLFSVSKKRFKRAVDRNLIKRQMRESYRQQKQQMLFSAAETIENQLIFSVIYVGKEISDTIFMMRKMEKVLHQLAEKLNG